MFMPSDEQRTIRSQARRLYDTGFRLIGELCTKIPNLTLRKWRLWEKQGGFMDWWVELFPEHSEMCLSDLRALEFEAIRCLMKSLSGGDLQAVGLVIKMMGIAQAREMTEGIEDSWFADAADGDWLPPVVADA